MKIQILHRSGKATTATVVATATMLFVAGSSASAPSAFAADPDVKPGQPDIAINVETFRDLGGADYKGPDGKPLTERLVLALRQAIALSAKHGYKVADPTDAYVVARNATPFVVESEVTALEIGDPSSRPYMLVSRLYREGKPRKLVAQFAGNARTLRDLTGNMMNQAGVSTAGLIGGIGKEIVDAAEGARPIGDSFEEMVKSTTATRRITVDIMNDASGKEEPRLSLTSGEKFRLRVNSQDKGAVYIVAIDPATKRPSTPYAQNEPLDVAPGASVTLPPNDPFVAPKTGTTLEYIVFVRKREGDKNASAAASRDRAAAGPLSASRSLQVAALLGLATGAGTSTAPSQFVSLGATVLAQATPPDAIELLSSPTLKGSSGGALDPAIAALLGQFQSDPEHSWTAARVKIDITK